MSTQQHLQERELNKVNVAMLESFLRDQMITVDHFAHCIGVTPGAVRHWLDYRRDVPEIAMKIINFCIKNNLSIREFCK